MSTTETMSTSIMTTKINKAVATTEKVKTSTTRMKTNTTRTTPYTTTITPTRINVAIIAPGNVLKTAVTNSKANHKASNVVHAFIAVSYGKG